MYPPLGLRQERYRSSDKPARVLQAAEPTEPRSRGRAMAPPATYQKPWLFPGADLEGIRLRSAGRGVRYSARRYGVLSAISRLSLGGTRNRLEPSGGTVCSFTFGDRMRTDQTHRPVQDAKEKRQPVKPHSMYDFAKRRIGAKTPASKRMAIRTDVEPPHDHPAANNPERQCNDRQCGSEKDEQ